MSYVHGSRSTYVNHGCRCVACSAANTEFMREFRSRINGTLAPDDSRHGLATTYTNYGCRCAPCTAAWAAYNKARRQKKQEAH